VVKFVNGDEDEDEYDSVPNCWFLSDSLIRYPDKGRATVRRLAKKSEMPEEDWLQTSVLVIRKDYGELRLFYKFIFGLIILFVVNVMLIEQT
jgi:hypothetical protein